MHFFPVLHVKSFWYWLSNFSDEGKLQHHNISNIKVTLSWARHSASASEPQTCWERVGQQMSTKNDEPQMNLRVNSHNGNKSTRDPQVFQQRNMCWESTPKHLSPRTWKTFVSSLYMSPSHWLRLWLFSLQLSAKLCSFRIWVTSPQMISRIFLKSFPASVELAAIKIGGNRKCWAYRISFAKIQMQTLNRDRIFALVLKMLFGLPTCIPECLGLSLCSALGGTGWWFQ